MAPWTFMRINYIPMTLGIVFSSGLALVYIIAVLRGDVSPYIPFISETGAKYPEAGLFSIFLYLGSTIGLVTVIVRYVIVDELNRSIDRAIDILNRTALVIGFIAMMGMVVVGAYPMTTIMLAHAIGANILFLGGVIYAALQTALSYRMTPFYNGKRICHIRLTISVLSTISLISMIVVQSFAQYEWRTGSHSHWTGGKTPEDQGFDLLLASAVFEWTLAILFILFYFTFIREFSKVCLHFRVQLLVQHFDDEPHDDNVAVATEHTPIVM